MLLPPEVVQAARQGKRNAEVKLHRWMRALLMPYFQRYFKVWHCHDLLQETEMDVFKKLDKAPHDPNLFRGWVYGFAWNEVRALLRKTRREGRWVLLPGSPEPVPPQAPGPETRLRNQEISELVWRCADELTDNHREAISHVLDGGNYRTLAEAAGISQEAARKRIHDARKQLRALVRKQRVSDIERQSSPIV